MRRQDELLALYEGKDVLTRKFIISQLDGLALTFDSDELLEFVQGEVRATDARISNQALFTLVHFMPTFMRRRFGLEASTIGLWSSHGQVGIHLEDSLQGLEADKRDSRDLQAAFLVRSAPLIQALHQRIAHSNPGVATMARLALSHFPLNTVAEALLKSSIQGGPGFQGALPYALIQEANPETSRLARLILARVGSEPDLALLVGALPARQAVQVIADVASRTNSLGRINLALATSRIVGDINHMELFPRLLGHNEGWVLIYCLRTMELLGNPRFLRFVRSIYEKSAHDFVKLQAIRTAGGLPGDESIEFCLGAMQSQDSSVQAQALESLVRLRCPKESLHKVAEPLVRSYALRTKVNAILASRSASDDALPSEVDELLLSNDTMTRLEAAFILGYIQNRRSLSNLATLANLDPDINVRLQAIKSLSKYPARLSIPCLVPIVRFAEDRGAVTATRVLTRYEADEGAQVCHALLEELAQCRSSFQKSLLYRAIGMLAGKTAYSRAAVAVRDGLEDPDPSVALGAAEGCILFGGPQLKAAGPKLLDLARKGDPRIIPRVLLGLFLSGEPEALDHMGRLTVSMEGTGLASILQANLELAILVGQKGFGSKFPDIHRKLIGMRQDPRISQLQASGDLAASATRWLEGPDPAATPKPAGEFPVSRRLRNLPSPTVPDPLEIEAALGPGEAGLPLDPGEDERLREHLGSPSVKKAAQTSGFQDGLTKSTYLVSEDSPEEGNSK